MGLNYDCTAYGGQLSAALKQSQAHITREHCRPRINLFRNVLHFEISDSFSVPNKTCAFRTHCSSQSQGRSETPARFILELNVPVVCSDGSSRSTHLPRHYPVPGLHVRYLGTGAYVKKSYANLRDLPRRLFVPPLVDAIISTSDCFRRLRTQR